MGLPATALPSSTLIVSALVAEHGRGRHGVSAAGAWNRNKKKLQLDSVIPGYKPYILLKTHKHPNKDLNKVYKSIAYKYQTVGGMLPLYDLFYEE